MDEKRKEFEREETDLKEQMEILFQTKKLAGQKLAGTAEEIGGLIQRKQSAEEYERTLKKAKKDLNKACVEQVNKIMFDGVCSTLNVRLNVIKAAKSALGIKSIDALPDCEMSKWKTKG